MFGDYFKNLTTNQKIMFGVAVFLVVCVIVYLLYKYVFKAAKNFISNFIMNREPFEQLKLTVKTGCPITQYYNGSQCSDLPANMVIDGDYKVDALGNPVTKSFLKYVLSFRGKYISNNYVDSAPPADRLPYPIYSTTRYCNYLVGLNFSTGITRVDETNTNNYFIPSSASRISPTLGESCPIISVDPTISGVLQTGVTMGTNAIGVYVKKLQTALSKLVGSESSGLTSDDVFYSTSYTVPDASNDIQRGTLNFYIPLKSVNYLPPTLNLPNNALLNTSPDLKPGAANEYSNALSNCKEYINNFKLNNKKYLGIMCATLFKSKNWYRQNLDLTEANIAPFIDGSDYDVVSNSSNTIFYLKVVMNYNCGTARDQKDFCDPSNNPLNSVTRTFTQFFSESTSSYIFTDGASTIYNESCKATYSVNLGPNSCGQTSCAFGNISDVYNGLGNSFRMQTGAAANPFVSQFDRGQSVILPPTLTTLGNAASMPEWYAVSRQWQLNVSQIPSLGGQQCTNVSLIQGTIGGSYIFDPSCDFMNIIETTNPTTNIKEQKVLVTRRIKAKYYVKDPSQWQLYAVDAAGNIATGINASQSQTNNNLLIIGAQINSIESGTNIKPGIPQFVPILVANKSNSSADTIYYPQDKSRSSTITVYRNIWAGLNFTKSIGPTTGNIPTKNPDGTWITLNSGGDFGTLLRSFINLATTNTNLASIPTDAMIQTITGNTTLTDLPWGISYADALSGTLTKNLLPTLYSSLGTPTSSFNVSNIDIEGSASNYFWENNVNNSINYSNSFSLAGNTFNNETIQMFRASMTRIIFVTGSQNSFNRKLYYCNFSTTTGFGTPVVINLPLRGTNPPSFDMARDLGYDYISSIDITSDGNRAIIVTNSTRGDIYNILFTTSGGIVTPTVSRITISSPPSNETLSFNNVRFGNRNNSSNNYIVLTTDINIANPNQTAGNCYLGTISTSSIILQKLNTSAYNIRSISVTVSSSTDANTPSKISLACYNFGIIVYTNSSGTTYTSSGDNQGLNGKWVSVSMNNDGNYIVASSEYFGTSLNPLSAYDGRIIFSQNGGSDWTTIQNPIKYTGNVYQSSDPNYNKVDPTSTTFDQFFNGYNFTSVDLIFSSGLNNTTIIATYKQSYNTDPNTKFLTTSTFETINGSGLLQIVVPKL